MEALRPLSSILPVFSWSVFMVPEASGWLCTSFTTPCTNPTPLGVFWSMRRLESRVGIDPSASVAKDEQGFRVDGQVVPSSLISNGGVMPADWVADVVF